MVEFGDELVLESLRIPWLMWIQLLVMFLLLLLLYSFTSSSSSNHDDSSSAAASSSSLPSPSPPPPRESRGSHSRKQFLAHGGARQLQVRESQSVKGFIATSTSRRVAGEEDTMEGENSSHGYMDHHPCSIVRLARIAFLKCFGLDFTSEDSSFKRHRR